MRQDREMTPDHHRYPTSSIPSPPMSPNWQRHHQEMEGRRDGHEGTYQWQQRYTSSAGPPAPQTSTADIGIASLMQRNNEMLIGMFQETLRLVSSNAQPRGDSARRALTATDPMQPADIQNILRFWQDLAEGHLLSPHRVSLRTLLTDYCQFEREPILMEKLTTTHQDGLMRAHLGLPALPEHHRLRELELLRHLLPATQYSDLTAKSGASRVTHTQRANVNHASSYQSYSYHGGQHEPFRGGGRGPRTQHVQPQASSAPQPPASNRGKQKNGRGWRPPSN